jgi:transcriptional regulator with XRE-family HTH domain
MISIEQIKAARALLGWSQTELGQQAGLSLPTIKRLEGDTKLKVSEEARAKIIQTLEAAGIEFTNGRKPGVRLSRPKGSTD